MKSKEINDDDIISEFGDESCFVFKILAIIASKTHRIELTAEMYKKSLKLNPFLWHSFEQLCNLGYEPDPNDIFTVSKMENFTCCHGINPVVNYVNNNLSEKNYPVNNSSSHNNMDLHYKRYFYFHSFFSPPYSFTWCIIVFSSLVLVLLYN